jgi:heme/copper-type cytochrome/quinol oxidase subunit 1
MIVAWTFVAPAGIAVTRYFKGNMSKHWFKLYMFGGVTILLIAGVAIVWLGVEEVYSTHFDPANYEDVVGDIHVVVGLIVLIMMFLQVVGGIAIDRMYDPKRTSIPFMDKLHWWYILYAFYFRGGRFATLFAIVNVFLGISLFEELNFGDGVPYYIAAVGILALSVGALVLFQVKMGQTHDAGGPKVEPAGE